MCPEKCIWAVNVKQRSTEQWTSVTSRIPTVIETRIAVILIGRQLPCLVCGDYVWQFSRQLSYRPRVTRVEIIRRMVTNWFPTQVQPS